jgi:hypothetical protein
LSASEHTITAQKSFLGLAVSLYFLDHAAHPLIEFEAVTVQTGLSPVLLLVNKNPHLSNAAIAFLLTRVASVPPEKDHKLSIPK